MDRLARRFGTAFLLALTWPGSAVANARQSATPNPTEAKLPRAQLRTVGFYNAIPPIVSMSLPIVWVHWS